jgi:hypothetical protein
VLLNNVISTDIGESIMQVSSMHTDVDFFNYHAITLLELLGKYDPSQLEIDLIENGLKNIFDLRIPESFAA